MVYMSNDEEGSLREDKFKKKNLFHFFLDKVPHIITALKTGLPIEQNELKPSLTEFKKNMWQLNHTHFSSLFFLDKRRVKGLSQYW